MNRQLFGTGKWGYWRASSFVSRVLALASFLATLTLDVQAEAGDSVKISSVHTYLARNIESGEPGGHLLLVRANVFMSSATASSLEVRIAVPVLLAPWIEMNGKQYLQCVGWVGSGLGGLPLYSLWHPEDGEPIWPIFYVPEDFLEIGDVIDLIMVIQKGGWLISQEPVSRASIPWTKQLVDGGLAAVRVDFVGVSTEERTDYKKTMGATRLMQAVSLRLPAELLPAIVGINSEMYCGSERAEDFTIADPFVARFVSPVDPLSCQWEVRLTKCGVKLKMDVSKSRGNDSGLQ